jgi:replication initiation and membrane attachment protein DnaB
MLQNMSRLSKSFINKINEEVAKEAVRARTQELFGQPTMPDVNDPRPNPKPAKNPEPTRNPEPAKKPDPKPTTSQSMPITEETVNHFLETGETLVFNNSNGNMAGVGTIEDLGRVLNTRTSTPTSTANVTTTS